MQVVGASSQIAHLAPAPRTFRHERSGRDILGTHGVGALVLRAGVAVALGPVGGEGRGRDAHKRGAAQSFTGKKSQARWKNFKRPNNTQKPDLVLVGVSHQLHRMTTGSYGFAKPPGQTSLTSLASPATTN